MSLVQILKVSQMQKEAGEENNSFFGLLWKVARENGIGNG